MEKTILTTKELAQQFDEAINELQRKDGSGMLKLASFLAMLADTTENSIFYKNETNKKGVFLTTNKAGELTYVSENGKLKYTDFGEFSPNHFFFYED